MAATNRFSQQMPEIHAWVYTRGETWDYRWLSNSPKSPPFPGAEAGILKRVGLTKEPNAPGAVAVWYDELSLLIASGSYSERRDRHNRRIQQHLVVSYPSAKPPLASQ